MWRFFHVLIALFVFIFTTVTDALPHTEPSKRIDEGDTSLLIQEFYRAVEEGINHLVVSRDMHKLVRHKRQLDNFGSGGFGQGGFGQGGFGQGGGGLGGLLGGLGGGGGGGGFGQGGFLDSVTNLASLASLDSLGSGAASGLPILQGIGVANNAVKSIIGLDRMQCSARLACEFMANRGLFNRSSAFLPTNVLPVLPENAQGALNLSHPSTFRSVLGVLQLMRFQEFGAYPVFEAGLWGVAHRDNNRCRSQFTKCPSTAEAFITELNSTPGGLQSMLTNGLQTIRNTLPGADTQGLGSDLLGSSPQTAANVADLGSLGSLGNFAQQGGSALGSLAGLAGLGGLGGNQQQFFDPSSSLGGSNFGANGNLASLGLNGGNGFGGSGFGNVNGLNGLNGAFNGLNGGLSGVNGGFNGLNGGFNGVNAGLNGLNAGLGGGLSGVNGGFNGLNGGFNGVNTGLNGGLSGGLSGVNAGFGGLNGVGSVSGLNGGFGSASGFNGGNFAGASGLNGLGGLGNSHGLNLGSSFGSQIAGQGFQQGGFGGFNGLSGNFRSGLQETGSRPIQKPKWKWGSS